ncbi:hypothetical protein [Mucilaginibacter ginsenosidivorax]|uniref:Uncharacterized protein n=1 Tax=Mucilaginibacter ginsenosidivorax TaxID=862126 RepID=A0A5B8VX79_9SPHI|nr:hypothetical protein [Mucilaginibacter ginsenosidivorax]QEC75801.1 hypothetical protein FSB76_07495 [Mucilaginibacter ginsenosidivorax]
MQKWRAKAMDMQDKDLDKLFQSALNDYEIEPSAEVWTGITGELDAGKRKRVWLPYLSIAAAAVLLITAGVLFIPKEVKTINPKKDGLAGVSHPIQPKTVAGPIQATQPETSAGKQPEKALAAPANSLAAISIHKPNKKAVITAIPVTAEPARDIAKPADQQPVLASATNKQEVKVALQPDTVTRIFPKHIDETPVFAGIKSPVAPTEVATIKPTVPVKKHKIRSLGDVFNVMIAAVDKRKDKIIEFSNTDEDDATITGVNLGIIKVKKEK